MKKRFVLAFAIAILVLVYNLRVAFHEGNSPFIEAGRASLKEYQALVDDRIRHAISKVFEELDKNHDGAISKEEFGGVRISLLAALHTASESFHFDLPQLPTSPLSLISRIVAFHFIFLAGLFLCENLRAVLGFGSRCGLTINVDYKGGKPAHGTTADALFYDTPLKKSWYEKAKIVFFVGTGIVFTRLFLVLLGFVVGVGACNLAIIGGRSRQKNPKWFAFCMQILCAAGWVLIHGLGFYHIHVVGDIAKTHEAKILVANHVCVVEVVILFAIFGGAPSFVSRIENLSIPLFRAVVESSHSIVVDRDAAASRTKTLENILERARDPTAAQLMVFPEGTCANHRTLFQFRRGAFEAGQPIQMVCFKYPYTHFNPSWTGRMTGGSDMLDLLLRLMSQFVNHCEIAFLPVYSPTPEETADSTKYAAHVQSMMATVLRLPVTDATYADYVALAKEKQAKKDAAKLAAASPKRD